ncbi:methyltransferase domain-containing protein [Nocardioides sp. BP30]|uniref:methyltransferase domain-containing protein n=1 Tax=Nocardioides sp. BP30 TaxID=3036374 RepID=UPI0024689F60|nr:methyltransferase domain-containing protein [Nocardioides sp. BP30]WGL53699.1 methyltransferase domain-containing protein [Nocardioides sp. BP30]
MALIGHAERMLEISSRSGPGPADLAGLAEREAGSYDVVLLDDVLATPLDPAVVVRQAVDLLRPDGRLVVSVPNIGHGSVRLAVLQGGASPAQLAGFHSRRGLIRLLEDCDLVAEELSGSLADPLGDPWGAADSVGVVVDPDRLPPHVVEWVRDQEDAFVYRFHVRARRRADPSETSVSAMASAVSLDAVRLHDRFTEERIRDERDALRRRDHVLGLQVKTTTAQLRAEKAVERANALRQRTAALRERLANKDRRIAELEHEVAALKHEVVVASAGWAGLARSAARRLRRR